MSTTWYDTVATLGWLAGITSRVRLMSHVYIATLRHPLRAAKEFATLDLLSNGRLIVGVGAGHVTEEFAVLGPEFAERGQALDESIDAIAAALTDEFPELPGPRWPATDLGIRPRPVQRPRPPIWVGGSSRPALRRAAARGDGWLPQTAKRSELKVQVAELLEFRRQLRDGAPIAIGALAGTFHVGQASWDLPKGTVSGPPDKIAEDLAELVELGVSHLQLRFPVAPWTSCATRWRPSASRSAPPRHLIPPSPPDPRRVPGGGTSRPRPTSVAAWEKPRSQRERRRRPGPPGSSSCC